MAKRTRQYKDVKNARAQAQRRINKLQGMLSTTQYKETRESIQSRLAQYNKALEGVRTYSSKTGKRVRTSEQVAQNLKTLRALNFENNDLVQSMKQANKAMQIEINRASVGLSDVYTKEQVHIFYRETMKYWQNVSNIENRNEAIMKGMGMNNLQKLFKEVTGDEKAIQKQWAMNVINDENATEEDRKKAFDILKDNEDDFQKSPNMNKSDKNIPDIVVE